jgi:hypothetical protein
MLIQAMINAFELGIDLLEDSIELVINRAG